jgi:DNA-binding transcriptional MerR regulator
MLTISQLATYAGVTVRAVRHYHHVGLLPEPARTASGYRTYDATAVIRLIQIRTLADAGVPLGRVQELLYAGPEEFAAGVRQIDADLRAEIRRLQENRRRIAALAAGDSLALPASVVGYLGRLRSLGVDGRYVALERGAWIMIAAQAPDVVDASIAKKHAELDDPDMVALYRFLSEAVQWSGDDPRIVDIAILLERLMIRAVEAGEADADGLDDPIVDLLDAMTVESSPVGRRLIEILQSRGWKGWTRIERVPVHAQEVGERTG